MGALKDKAYTEKKATEVKVEVPAIWQSAFLKQSGMSEEKRGEKLYGGFGRSAEK